MRILFLSVSLFATLIGATPAHGARTIVLAFEIGDAPVLISATASTSIHTAPGISRSGGWTLALTDPAGVRSWHQSVPQPKRFHDADRAQPATFVKVVPRPAPGDKLQLVDAAGNLRWEASVDPRFLAEADAAGETARASRRHHTRVMRSRSAPLEMPVALWSMPDRPSDAPVGASPGAMNDFQGEAAAARLKARRATLTAPAHAAQSGPTAERTPSLGNPPLPDRTRVVGALHQGLAEGWVIEATLIDASTNRPITATPLANAITLHADEFQSFPVETSPGRIRFTVPSDPSVLYRVELSGLPNFSRFVILRFGPLAGNESHTVSIEPGRAATVQLATEGGVSLPDSSPIVSCDTGYSLSPIGYSDEAIAEAGVATLRLPHGSSYSCRSYFDSAALSVWRDHVRFSSTTPAVLPVPATVETAITLQTPSGAIHDGDIQGTWEREGAQGGCNTNPCRIHVPRNHDVNVHFNMRDGREFERPWTGLRRFTAGSNHVLVLDELYRVEGRVETSALDETLRIRAINADTGRLVTSTMAQRATGRFVLPLARGRYIIESESQAELYDNVPALLEPSRSGPVTVTQPMQLPDIKVERSSGTLSILTRVPCSLPGNYRPNMAARLGITSAEGARVVRTVLGQLAGNQNGECSARYATSTGTGVYSMAFSPLGWPPRDLGPVTINAGQTTEINLSFAAAERTLVWRGSLQDASGRAMSGASMHLYDEAMDNRTSWSPDASGGFEIPFQPGWTVEVRPAFRPDSRLLAQVMPLGNTPPAPVLKLSELPAMEEWEGNLLRIFGSGDRARRINMLFLAEGYSAVQESFSDANANGRWDGVVWYDIDRNGVLSGSDLVRTYGNAPYPVSGSVPTAGNEPFNDLNGDGFPNIDDQAMFVSNARSFVQSLLGSHVWNRYGGALNAYVLFSSSEQAGISVRSTPTTPAAWRRTKYGATYSLTDGLVGMYGQSAAMSDALGALPEVDVVIVAVNHIVGTGRSSAAFGSPASITFVTGPSQHGTDETAPHEMAHALASLCDEYSSVLDFAPSVLAANSDCANASFSADPTRIPWFSSLPGDSAIPSRHIDDSLGVFEGATYYSSGTYRPSYRSMMRNLTPLFNAPSADAIEAAIEARAGPLRVPEDSTGRCLNLPVNSVHLRGGRC